MYFTRSNASFSAIMVSTAEGDQWSQPQIASFSGKWLDLEPAMAPGGTFLVFASNRPTTPGSSALDREERGHVVKGEGANLWRVDKKGSDWGAPVRLPDAINGSTAVFSPSVAGNDGLYFASPENPRSTYHIYYSAYRDGAYQPAIRLTWGTSDTEEFDPAVAPDESFIVFSMSHPGTDEPNRLCISFRAAGGWSKAVDLGDAINGEASNVYPRLSPDARTLYFDTRKVPPHSGNASRDDTRGALLDMSVWANGRENIWFVPLTPWLKAMGVGR